LENTDTIDDCIEYLQDKTIQAVEIDEIDSRFGLVFLLSNGSRAYIYGYDSIYMAIEKPIIN
jgi:hypothetical protein